MRNRLRCSRTVPSSANHTVPVGESFAAVQTHDRRHRRPSPGANWSVPTEPPPHRRRTRATLLPVAAAATATATRRRRGNGRSYDGFTAPVRWPRSPQPPHPSDGVTSRRTTRPDPPATVHGSQSVDHVHLLDVRRCPQADDRETHCQNTRNMPSVWDPKVCSLPTRLLITNIASHY